MCSGMNVKTVGRLIINKKMIEIKIMTHATVPNKRIRRIFINLVRIAGAGLPCDARVPGYKAC